MSGGFFGFDTSMPAMGAGDSLDDRLRRMAEADENIQIYDFEQGGLENLGAGLEESLDDFNDDTFGTAPVGRDFDFAGNTSSFLGAPSQPQKPGPSPGLQTKPASSFASFGADPLLGPVRSHGLQGRTPSQQLFQAPAQAVSPALGRPAQGMPVSQGQGIPTTSKPKFRTLEEIEAEMQAQSQARASPTIQLRASPAIASRPQAKTLEEIEAEMLRQAQSITGQDDVGMKNLVQQAQALALQQPEIAQPATSSAQQQPDVFRQLAEAQKSAMNAAGQSMLDQLFPALPGQKSGLSLEDPNLIHSVEARIREAEAAELARQRKAAKIHRMAKYNNIMTQGDKDFITRIQVSQLVNSAGPNGSHDPYVDDFYFAVMQSIRNSRLQAEQARMGPGPGPDGRPLPPGAGPAGPGPQGPHDQQGGKGPRGGDKRQTRRDNAMNRMAQQVQRIVDDAKKKPRATQLSLEGALGKIAIRTRSAPRPLLQVGGKGEEESASVAAVSTLSSSLNQESSGAKAGPSLSRREILLSIEHVYDIVLQLEMSRRQLPSLAAHAQAELQAEHSMRAAGAPPESIPTRARAALAAHESEYAELVERMWKGLKVMEPLDLPPPHPFIAMLSVTKGKKLLPRALRHVSQQQTLTILTLLVACFDTLDVVVDAPILDSNPNDPMLARIPLTQRKTRKQVELETETFLNVTIPLVMGTVGTSSLRIVTGMLGLLIERNDLARIAKTKPGLAYLTLFVSRAHILKETSTASPGNPVPEPTELQQWTATFNHFFTKLTGNLPALFPSTRSVPFGAGLYTAQSTPQSESILDAEDEPVWHFLAAMAVLSDMSQQQVLVTEVRDKVLENVIKAKRAQSASGQAGEFIAQAKIRNVNTFLHALGLDAAQVTVE